MQIKFVPQFILYSILSLIYTFGTAQSSAQGLIDNGNIEYYDTSWTFAPVPQGTIPAYINTL